MHPCQIKPSKNTGKKSRKKPEYRPVNAKPVDDCATLNEIFNECLPAFGGAYLKRVYQILYRAISNKIPLIVTVAGPITLSDQHRCWLIPLIKRGWVAYLTVTDAICYHDGHDSLRRFPQRPIFTVDLFGDDAAYRDAGIVRVGDLGFHEEILFEQDKMISAMLQRPEFQKKMTTTERNHLFGKYYAAQEEKFGVSPCLLSTCARNNVPVFIGAAADGSVFLNSVKLRVLGQIGEKRCALYAFDYDLHADVFETCAYHYWGLFNSGAKALAVLILGGGVPKNYSLQPEPMLSQILLLDKICGCDFDVQIVSAPVTDGSLSSCFPSEAVSWGKVNPKTYRQATESLQGDYSMLMPFIVKALTESLPPRPQLELYKMRGELVKELLAAIRKKGAKLKMTLDFPLELAAQTMDH